MVFMTFHILGMSSSQPTSIFFRGVETTNQYIYGTWVHPTTVRYIKKTMKHEKTVEHAQYVGFLKVINGLFIETLFFLICTVW